MTYHRSLMSLYPSYSQSTFRSAMHFPVEVIPAARWSICCTGESDINGPLVQQPLCHSSLPIMNSMRVTFSILGRHGRSSHHHFLTPHHLTSHTLDPVEQHPTGISCHQTSHPAAASNHHTGDSSPMLCMIFATGIMIPSGLVVREFPNQCLMPLPRHVWNIYHIFVQSVLICHTHIFNMAAGIN